MNIYLKKRCKLKFKIVFPIYLTCTSILKFYTFFSLTEREKRDREHKKKLLSLAREHEQARELERVQRYHMPQDLGKGSTADYIEVDEFERMPHSEQRKWEQEQMASAVFSFGAKDIKKQTKEDYDLLLEDQIEFIKALQMPGAKETKEPQLTEAQRKKLDIEETKKSLPVFPFKEDIIAAVRDHQVLIIEGETGSGKTTQIPQYLHDAGFTNDGKKIGCTQPRRVAAMSVAARVAQEMTVKLGKIKYLSRYIN